MLPYKIVIILHVHMSYYVIMYVELLIENVCMFSLWYAAVLIFRHYHMVTRMLIVYHIKSYKNMCRTYSLPPRNVSSRIIDTHLSSQDLSGPRTGQKNPDSHSWPGIRWRVPRYGTSIPAQWVCLESRLST